MNNLFAIMWSTLDEIEAYHEKVTALASTRGCLETLNKPWHIGSI